MRLLIEKLYFLLIFGEITGIVTRIFGEGGSTADAAAGHTTNPILFCFVALAGLGTAYYSYPKLLEIWRMLLQLKWIFLIYSWMLLSVFWTETPPITAFGSLRMVVYLLSAAYFSLRFTTEELLLLLSRCFVVSAILSVPGQYLLGEGVQDDGIGWGGIYPHKNWLGFGMMTAISILLVLPKPSGFTAGLKRVSCLLICIALLLLSQSYTAILSTIVTAAFVIAARSELRSKVMFGMLLSGGLCIMLLISHPLELLLAAGGKSSSFTGRDAVWAFAIKGIAQRPLEGHGYAAFWSNIGWTLGVLHWSPPHAHNGFLQVSLDLGLVGLALTVGVLVNNLRRARRVQKFDDSIAGIWMLTLLVMTFVHNLTEADLMLFDLLWYLLMVGSFSLLTVENCAFSDSLPSSSASIAKTELFTV